jgi:putative nucleotidyltransferase with HDIG domain
MQPFASGAQEIILKRIRDIPSLPEVVTRIMEIIGEPNTPASEIAKLISYDPGLTSKVLRMVNSAAYGFQRQISSIQHGIMILGFNTVRGLVLSASIFKMFEGQAQNNSLGHQQFWEHSMGTAVAARMLAQKFRIPDADDIFSAAMLHDIGKIVLDVYFAANYHPVLQVARSKGIPFHGAPFYQLEEDMLGMAHTGIGNCLASKWKLPVTITEVIEYHHQPSLAPNCQMMVYVVALANEMAVLQYEKKGIYDREHFSEEVLAYFDLSDDDLVSFLDELQLEMGSAHDLLKSISRF